MRKSFFENSFGSSVQGFWLAAKAVATELVINCFPIYCSKNDAVRHFVAPLNRILNKINLSSCLIQKEAKDTLLILQKFYEQNETRFRESFLMGGSPGHQTELRHHFVGCEKFLILNAFRVYSHHRKARVWYSTIFFLSFIEKIIVPLCIEWYFQFLNTTMFTKPDQQSSSYSDEMYGSEPTEKTIPFLR